MSFSRQLVAMSRLELAEVLRSRWIWFCLVAYGLLSAVFVLVGLRASSIVGFTGMGRVLLSFSHVLVLLVPLLGLLATGQVIGRAREDGSLELWFGHPVSRGAYFLAVTLVRYLTLLAPLVILMPVLGIIGRVAFGQRIPWDFVARTLAVSASLLFFAVATGLMVGTFVRNQARALMTLLAIWALTASLLDFALAGLMLQWRLQPLLVFTLAALNPVQDARLALISAAEPELQNLGPIGFWLANRVGATGLLAVGLLWPALLGLGFWLATWRNFQRKDLV